MADMFRFADDLGPLKIIHIHNPAIGLRAVLVVDNIARGPAIGGLRMASDVTTGECVRLARAMSLKNAAAGLKHGGAKTVIYGNQKMQPERKQLLIRGLAQALKTESSYIFGPDMGTNEECMAWIWDEIGRAIGLPEALGGLPLDEIGATGWGMAHAAEIASEFLDVPLEGARIVVEGFGAVGKHAARNLIERGAILVAVADSAGAVYHRDGLDFGQLVQLKDSGKSVIDYVGGQTVSHDEFIETDCDIWIPAARPDVINKHNAHLLNTKLIIEGANIAVTAEASALLHDRHITCIPDFIANAGGVICAAMEYQGATLTAAMDAIENKVRHNTSTILDQAHRHRITPRAAALGLARQNIEGAMNFRRWSVFSSGPDLL